MGHLKLEVHADTMRDLLARIQTLQRHAPHNRPYCPWHGDSMDNGEDPGGEVLACRNCGFTMTLMTFRGGGFGRQRKWMLVTEPRVDDA